jgi:Na+/melibiose symporter-like transporter
MSPEQAPLRPPLSQLLIYALGQFGWSLASFGAANLLVYFYLPPATAEEGSVFPPFIFQGAILGIATLIGFINFGGRLFDAITDPLVAAWSDARPRKGGKRRRVLRLAAFPFAALSVLLFLPPAAEVSAWNAIWLVAVVLLFYFFLTLYVVPYNALISELGHVPEDRMRISTLISITWALGFLVGGTAYGLQGFFEHYFPPVRAFQVTIGLFASFALLLMLVPAFFLREERYTEQPVTERLSARASLREVLTDPPFRRFIFSDLLYWLALTFIQQGVSFYVTILFGWPKEQATTFLTVSFLGSFALYWPVNALVRRYGKRPLLLAAFLVFALVFLLTALFRHLSLPTAPVFYALAILSAFPLAAFGIVPNALIADFIHWHGEKTGRQQAGMFYAVRNFMMKVGISLSYLIFPSLLLLGRSTDQPLGVEMSAWVATGICLLGWVIFRGVRLRAGA